MIQQAGHLNWFRQWGKELLRDERRVMRLVILLACLLVSTSIGYVYARRIFVAGWQLWTWLLVIIIAAAALFIEMGQPALAFTRQLARNWLFARDRLFSFTSYGYWLALLVFAGLLLRLLFVSRIPGALHVDEVGIADFSLRHIFFQPGETINPFRSGPASQPSFYHYLVRLSLALAGPSIGGLRLSSVFAGTTSILATYAVATVFQGRKVALFSAALMTTYHFHVHWSRIGLNNIWDTLWVPLMLAAFVWGWRRRWSGGAAIAGLAAGFSQYFYAGSRIGLLLLVFVFWYLWRQGRYLEDYRPRLVIYTAKMALMVAIVAVPLAIYAIADPVPFFERSRIVFGWKPETIVLTTGSPPDLLQYAWSQLWRSAGAFIVVPDVTGFYGPGVPLLIGLAAPLFIIGLFWAMYQGRWLPVLWIVLTVFLGGFLLADPPGSSHYVVAIPAICWLVAMPLEWLLSNGQARLAITLLILIMATDVVFYFGVYVPGNPRDLIHAFPPLPG